MALILIEGLDRAGKTTVAKYYESKGYKYIHLSAPPKELKEPGYAGPSYLDMMVDLVGNAASQDIVMDRTAWGETIWPLVYDREPLLNEEDLEIIKEIEDSVGVMRILMNDPNVEDHWKRCVANKEPLTKAQFLRAKSLYGSMAHKYGFIPLTLPDFFTKHPDAQVNYMATEESIDAANKAITNSTTTTATNANSTTVTTVAILPNGKTSEQVKLEEANAINELLSKRIIKQKGDTFDKLEGELKSYLNTRLGTLLGNSTPSSDLSSEEIEFFRALYKKAKSK